jgi:hypothetical protein
MALIKVDHAIHTYACDGPSCSNTETFDTGHRSGEDPGPYILDWCSIHMAISSDEGSFEFCSESCMTEWVSARSVVV